MSLVTRVKRKRAKEKSSYNFQKFKKVATYHFNKLRLLCYGKTKKIK